ncbi:glutathione hydrolase 7 isoform X2 [Pogoniulus pusillus]|uniref:glutathione hydrolase 7 isoform X2 n=1 Tax=Pogoniulus pusillus TaxID=488313 RepID=UPI0030B99F8B
MAAAAAGRQRALGGGSPVDYMSITSFPRLPEEEAAGAAEGGLRARKEEDAFLGEQDTDPDSFLKSARLQRLPSSSSELGSQDMSPLQETSKDPFAGDCSCRQDGLTVIITACLTFAAGVTVALVMQIYFGDPQIFQRGAVVTDSARCTALGIQVLTQQGSSVDAAIASALCAGVVNPHTSGLGGGGVMLVHDIRRNRSWAIDFREAAPMGILLEEHLQEDSKPGLLVGVPGTLRGMQQAHQLHGRLPWSKLLGLVAAVAQDGFNVTHDLAKAISELKDLNHSERFRETFLPGGQPLLPGTLVRRPDLAALLQLLGAEGASAFYSGNLTQEIISEVQSYGGVLAEEDFQNYSAPVEDPIHTVYRGHLVFSPPPPHAGPALVTALNILEGFNITSQAPRGDVLHWLAESVGGRRPAPADQRVPGLARAAPALPPARRHRCQPGPRHGPRRLHRGGCQFFEPSLWQWDPNTLWSSPEQSDVGLLLAQSDPEPLHAQAAAAKSPPAWQATSVLPAAHHREALPGDVWDIPVPGSQQRGQSLEQHRSGAAECANAEQEPEPEPGPGPPAPRPPVQHPAS